MNPIFVLFMSLIVLLVLSVPIGYSLGIASMITILFTGTMQLSFIVQKLFAALNSFTLLAVPFFILAGELMQGGVIAKKLLDLAKTIVGRFPGGLALVTTITSLFYGALSGAAAATCSSVGGLMIPTMKEDGYDASFSAAVAASSSCLGVLIPPSVSFVVYGIATGTSIGDLFIAGIGAGIVFALGLMVVSVIISKKRGYRGTSEKATFKSFLSALWDAKWSLTVPIIVLGGIYGGFVTPTEAACIAVVWTLIIECFIHKQLKIPGIIEALKKTAKTCARLFVVISSAICFGQVMTLLGVPDKLTSAILSIGTNKVLLLLMINIIMLIVGCFMDGLAAITIMSPLLLPIAKICGMGAIQFGVLMTVNTAIGMTTPPVGVSLYIGAQIAGETVEKTSKALLPFYAICIFSLLLITFIPGISMIFL